MWLLTNKGPAAQAELQQQIQQLPSGELHALWTTVFERLKTEVLQVVGEEKSGKGCLPLVAICCAAAEANIVSAPLVTSVEFLNGIAPLLEEGELLNCIQALCLSWSIKKHSGWKRLWLGTFSRAVALSLKKYSKKKTEELIAAVFNMKDGLVSDEDGLDTIELDISERGQLNEQLAPCAVSSGYLDCAKGRKIISIILTLNKSLAKAILKKAERALPFMTSAHIQALAQCYISAWKAVAGKEQATVLEENMQDIMEWTLRGDLVEAQHANLFRFLKVLHVARKDRAFTIMLYQCYLPILWRSLMAPNYKVRYYAAKVFFDSFPLLESTAAPEMEQKLAEYFKIMHNLLVDTVPDTRAVAVMGVCRVLTDFFDIIPIHERRALANDLINVSAMDLSSLESRVKVNQGLAYMVRNPKAHNLLKALIAENKENGLHDTHSVQLSYVSLLLAARKVPGFKFWQVAPPSDLLPLMAEGRPSLSVKVAKLLRNSYFNPSADQKQNVERSLLLHSLNQEAFRAFYTYLADITPLMPIMKFLVTICNILRLNCSFLKKLAAKEKTDPNKENIDLNKEDMDLSKSSSKEPSGAEVDKGNILQQQSVHILVEALAITYNYLVTKEELSSDALKEQWKYLVVLLKKTMNELFSTTDCLSMQISVLSVASLLPSKEVNSLAMRCLSLLRSFLALPERNTAMLLPAEAKACVLFLCNMRSVAGVLEIVAESLEKFKIRHTPIKSNRVRFCEVPQQSYNTELTLQVLRFVLESPYLQTMVLKSHKVPLFNTWSTLLSIVDLVHDFLCTSTSEMLIQTSMMTACDLFFLLSYVLHGQEHPVTKEEYVATATFTCQMMWMEEDLLPRLQCRRGLNRKPHLEVLKMFLKAARSVVMTTWVTFKFAEDLLKFLLLCQEITEEDQLKAPIALIPPTVTKFMPLFAHTEEQASIISALVNKISSGAPAEKCSGPQSQSHSQPPFRMDTKVVSKNASPSAGKHSSHASHKNLSAFKMDAAVASDVGPSTSLPFST